MNKLGEVCETIAWTCIFILAILCFIVAFTGCAAHPAPTPQPHGFFDSSKKALDDAGIGLDRLIILSVLAISAAVASFFLIPNHRLSLTLGIGGASVFGVSVLLRATLPLIPYLAVGLLIAALAAGCYEIYIHYIRKSDAATPK